MFLISDVFSLLLDLSVLIVARVRTVLTARAIFSHRHYLSRFVIIFYRAGDEIEGPRLFGATRSVWIVSRASAVKFSVLVSLFELQCLPVFGVECPRALGL